MTEQILLMTRPLKDAQTFVARLAADLADVQVIYSPLMEIVQTAPFPTLNGVDGVIFSSANGVAAAPKGAGLPAYCIGQRTTDRARQQGYDARLMGQDAAHLVAAMTSKAAAQRLVHICGTHRRGQIAERLQHVGIHVDVAQVYDQRMLCLSKQALAALSGEVPVILPLFSPRTAAHFVAQGPKVCAATAFALSNAVAHSIPANVFDAVVVVPEPTGDAMVQGIEKWLYGNRLS